MSLILDRVINVKRLDPDSDNTRKESYVSYAPLQDIACNIQPASTEDTVIAQGTYGQAYVCFTTASGILEGDRVVVEVTNEEYVVRGKTNWMSPGLSPHIELLLTEPETTE